MHSGLATVENVSTRTSWLIQTEDKVRGVCRFSGKGKHKWGEPTYKSSLTNLLQKMPS